MGRRGAALIVVVLAAAACGSDDQPYDPDHVGQSLARATKVRSYYPCSEQGEVIVCEMRGRGLARYRVRHTKEACWRAELESVSTGRKSAWPNQVEGCVRDSDADYPARPYD
jgi:hypothetical protein